jgi:hypothetical protein
VIGLFADDEPSRNHIHTLVRDAHQFEFVHTPEVYALEVVDHELPQSFGRMLCVELPCCGKPREGLEIWPNWPISKSRFSFRRRQVSDQAVYAAPLSAPRARQAPCPALIRFRSAARMTARFRRAVAESKPTNCITRDNRDYRA